MDNSPQTITPQQQNHRKLLIILGSSIGLLVIVMGGCVACGAVIGLSSLSNDGQTSSERRASGGGEGSDLSSSSWSGTLNCDDGDTLPFNIKFSESGNWLYHYETSRGGREEELKSSGQTLRFAAAGGGVTNVVVQDVAVSTDHIKYALSISHERSGGGTLIQQRMSLIAEAVLSGSTLEYQSRISSSSAASQPGYVIPDESTTICKASLRRN